MVRVDFRVLERFEGFRGQGFGVVVQRRRGSIPLFSSLFSYLLSELPEVLLNWELWSVVIARQRMERWPEVFSKGGGEFKEWEEEDKEFAELVRSDDPLSEFRPFASFEAERLFRHFQKELREFTKERSKVFRKLSKAFTSKEEVSTLPLEHVSFVERSFAYLRPLQPVHSALYVSLKAFPHSTLYLEVELALVHETHLSSDLPDFLTLKLLKGETPPENLTIIHASICPVCGNLSEDGKLCKTCRADKLYLTRALDFMEPWEKEAFLNGTLTKETFQTIWGRIKYHNPKLAYRLNGLYQKAKLFKPYIEGLRQKCNAQIGS